MDTKSILIAAFRTLQRAPIRSALTTLGIVVGTAALVTTTNIGLGAKMRVQELLATPDARTVLVTAAVPTSLRHRSTVSSTSDGLNADDYTALRRELKYSAALSPQVYIGTARAIAGARKVDVVIDGIDVEGFLTSPRALISGSLFGELDVKHAASVCVISSSLARALFPNSPLQERVRVNNATFIILGVVDDIPSGRGLRGSDDMHVYVPFTSLLRRINGAAPMSINVQAKRIDQLRNLQTAIGDILEHRRGVRKSEFRTTNAAETLQSYNENSATLARLLAAVSAVSLIVGGIGIMNIMLVSVAERTREIGIRLAVGTRSKDILCQFLAEAVALSVIGGVAGVLLGSTASWLVTRLNGWPTKMSSASILAALLCSIVVGIFFGQQPARRAAALSPVTSLREGV